MFHHNIILFIFFLLPNLNILLCVEAVLTEPNHFYQFIYTELSLQLLFDDLPYFLVFNIKPFKQSKPK